jgi:cell division transport system permease protein
MGDLVAELGSDFYSTSYIVTLTDLKLNEQVQNQISKFDHVKRITSSNETITRLLSVANGIKVITAVILVLLVLISIFIISNTIKLTVHARRKEISIMKYVGATNNFIRWPFIVEGMIIGVMASLISIVIVGGAYSIFAEQAVNASFMQVMNMSLVTFSDMISSIIFVYMLLGIGIGALGSVISMRKYLKV